MEEREVTAGGVVYRSVSDGFEILLIEDRFGYITFPKGHAEPGETVEQTALREIEEETGIKGEIDGPLLDTITYSYTNQAGKTAEKIVYYYLVQAVGGAVTPQIEEIDGVLWVPLHEATALQERRGYPNNMTVLEKALERLNAKQKGHLET